MGNDIELAEGLVEVPLTSFQLTVNVYNSVGKFDELIERLQKNGENKIVISASIFNEAKAFLAELKNSNNIMSADASDADKIIQCAGCCNGCDIGK